MGYIYNKIDKFLSNDRLDQLFRKKIVVYVTGKLLLKKVQTRFRPSLYVKLLSRIGIKYKTIKPEKHFLSLLDDNGGVEVVRLVSRHFFEKDLDDIILSISDEHYEVLNRVKNVFIHFCLDPSSTRLIVMKKDVIKLKLMGLFD